MGLKGFNDGGNTGLRDVWGYRGVMRVNEG